MEKVALYMDILCYASIMQISDTKKILLVLVAIVLFGLWQLVSMFANNYPIVNFPPKGATIVALGDSLTDGVGASSHEKNYIGLLNSRLNIRIINKGIAGNTTEDALRRLENDVFTLKPDIVIVQLGGNDYLKKIPEQETFSNLMQIIQQIQSHGAVVILLGVRGGLLHDKFSEDFENLAKNTGCILVPNILDGIIGNNKLMSDQVHPNDEGYLKIADKVAMAIAGLIHSVPKGTQGTAGVDGATTLTVPSLEK